MAGQSLAVLATVGDPHPHTSLVAFAVTRDLRNLVFATPVYTRKYDNILKNPRVSLLVDNRLNLERDFQDGVALTVKGTAIQPPAARRRGYARLYLQRHPYLEEFVSSPTCGLFVVEVHSYSLVSSFQNVQEWQIPSRPSS